MTRDIEYTVHIAGYCQRRLEKAEIKGDENIVNDLFELLKKNGATFDNKTQVLTLKRT